MEVFMWKKEWVRGNSTWKNAQRRALHNFPLPYITYRQKTLSQGRAAHPQSQKCFLGLWFDHNPKTWFRVEKLSAALGQYMLLWKRFCMFSIWNHTNIASSPVRLWNFEQLHFSSSLLSLTRVLTPPGCFASIFTYFNPTLPPISSSLFLSASGPCPCSPQSGFLLWKCLSSSRSDCYIILSVAAPGHTGLSPSPVSGINFVIILRQPPWGPIQLRFVLLVFWDGLSHVSGSLT